jgi:uncharacterized protein YqgV (UPF0045/DUF77 family)
MKKVNIAIQVLPNSPKNDTYALVDEAIKVITESGFLYKVCPFETVIECNLEEGLELVKKIHKTCQIAGTKKMMTYIKIQSDFENEVTIEDKME